MIAIIDYKAGNLTSVQLAFEALGVKAEITSNPQTLREADKIVFPGVIQCCAISLIGRANAD